MNKLRSYLKNKRLIIGFYLAPAIAAFSIALVMLPGIRPQAIDSIANSTADVVIGQPDMNSNLINQVGYGKTLYRPIGIHINGARLFVADQTNSRVLIYNSIPTSNNASADIVIGQPDMNSNLINQGGSVGANTLHYPSDVYSDGTRLFVADESNHRVLIYNSIPTSNNASADVVIGQPDMTSNSGNQGGSVGAKTLYYPSVVYSVGTRLFVSDQYNHRVLIYNSIPTSNNASADIVIGQPDMASNSINQGFPTCRANTLYYPYRVYSDGTKLFVADRYNHRVLIYNTIPTSNDASANVVIGQPNMTSNLGNQWNIGANTLYFPASIYDDGTRLYVADQHNHRVLIYNTIPTSNDASANVVIGQPNMTSNSVNQGSIGANTFCYPSAIYSYGTKLFVADWYNSRVLIYNTSPTVDNASADTVIGQPDFTRNQLNQSDICTANTLNMPVAYYSDGIKYFICDYYNHRVLIYNNIPTSNNAAADVVIGQPDMTHNSINQGGTVEANTLYYPASACCYGSKLFVTDVYNNRVLIYNSIPTSNNAAADIVIGQPNMTSNSANQSGGIVGANTLHSPYFVGSDGSKLFIADYWNHRVLIYNTIPTSNNTAADVVIGQQDMAHNQANQDGAPGPNTLYGPTSVYCYGTKLFVSDHLNNRVLIYNDIPTSNNVAADVVIGQPDTAHNSINQGGAAGANTLYYPIHAYPNGNRLFLADQYNHRVLIYNSIPTANNVSADIVIGQVNMAHNSANQGGSVGANTLYYPSFLFCDSSRLFVPDEYNSRILIYNLTTTKPVISEVKFDGSGYVSGDTIRTVPVISAKLTDTGGVGGIYINNLKITIDTTLYTYASFDASTDSYNSTTGIVTFKVKNTLSTGIHNVKIEISDYLGNWGTYEANNLNVNDSSGTVQLDGIPLNYPNPFRPLSETTKLTYKLTVDSDILIYIFDVRGVLIRKTTYSSGSMGGKAGYNEVTWDGKDDFGSTVGNGIYPFRIVAGGRVIGRGKIAVLE